jgi:hypothetical protein
LNAIESRSRAYAFKGHDRHASPEAAVAAAARTALVAALTDLTPPFTDTAPAIAGVEAAYTAALAAIPDGTAKQRGIALGKKSAYTILAERADDGASEIPLIVTDFPQGDEPGEYRFTPGRPFAFAPTWGDVRPFVLSRAGQIRIEPPFDLDSDEYAADFNEVKRLGGDGVTTPSARTADETEMARFWVESSPLMWNRLARQLATAERLDLWQSARLFGLLDLALTDGYIDTFKVKYELLFWRPVTAIPLAATDGNADTTADPTWTRDDTTDSRPRLRSQRGRWRGGRGAPWFLPDRPGALLAVQLHAACREHVHRRVTRHPSLHELLPGLRRECAVTGARRLPLHARDDRRCGARDQGRSARGSEVPAASVAEAVGAGFWESGWTDGPLKSQDGHHEYTQPA